MLTAAIGAQPVGPMVGPAGLAADEQPCHVGHRVEVGPQPTHGEMRARSDTHRHLSGVLAGVYVIHLQQVAVPLVDRAMLEICGSAWDAAYLPGCPMKGSKRDRRDNAGRQGTPRCSL